MKKIFVGLLTLGAVLVVIPMFAAFEAHVINVTARIENALSVSDAALDFGTVFPQEHLNKQLTVALSESFVDEGRVDDVSYFIRQKPKCALTNEDGTEIIGPTATGHINSDGSIDCGPRPTDTAGQTLSGNWGVLPSLCEYISKESPDENDGDLASFHQPWVVNTDGTIDWTDTEGYLSKNDEDESDDWTIDLAVPCFGGYCAQDWADFVEEINEDADPADYTQPIENEHKVFGCDLWVEVDGVSRAD